MLIQFHDYSNFLYTSINLVDGQSDILSLLNNVTNLRIDGKVHSNTWFTSREQDQELLDRVEFYSLLISVYSSTNMRLYRDLDVLVVGSSILREVVNSCSHQAYQVD
jgi:hypothetical protein